MIFGVDSRLGSRRFPKKYRSLSIGVLAEASGLQFRAQTSETEHYHVNHHVYITAGR